MVFVGVDLLHVWLNEKGHIAGPVNHTADFYTWTYFCLAMILVNAFACTAGNGMVQSKLSCVPCTVQRAPMLVNDIFFKDHVVVVGTLLAGIGPTCRGFPWCRPQ